MTIRLLGGGVEPWQPWSIKRRIAITLPFAPAATVLGYIKGGISLALLSCLTVFGGIGIGIIVRKWEENHERQRP